MSTTANYRSSIPLQSGLPAEASFLKLRPKYLAMASSSLVYVNLDLSVTIATLTAAASRIVELRPELARLYDFDLTAADELPDAIRGLEFTHAEAMACAHPSDALEDLNREAIQTRDRFIHDQTNLAKGGLIDPSLLGQFTGITGYKAVVTDLRTCVAVYRAIGKAAEGKSCCTAEDIDRAEGVMRRMERLIGDRILGRKSTREWIDMRARAFTLAVNDYSECRRGVTYLRWKHDDIDAFAPSLYKGRIKKRRSTAKTKAAEPEAPKPAAPQAPKPAEPQPVIGANGPFVPATAESPSPAPPRIPGMPGGSPFMQ